MGRKRQKSSEPRQEAWLTRVQLDVKHEADYIIGRAREGDARLVVLGPLVFFSTQTGDAWMLDLQDGLALWLARDGAPLPVRIEETDDKWVVIWDRQFRIDNGVFQTSDQAGRVTSFAEYPTEGIVEALRWAQSQQPPSERGE
jgi:hypothetical protein